MKISKFLTLISATFAGTIFSASQAKAVSVTLSNHDTVNGTFSYDVTLAAGESLDAGTPVGTGDSIAFTNLVGLTGVDSTNNATLQFNNSFDSISANLRVITDIAADTNPQTFNNAIILTSDSLIGDTSYFALTSGGAFSSTTLQGPATPVPFEVSPNTGIMIVFGIAAFGYYKKRSRSKIDDLK